MESFIREHPRVPWRLDFVGVRARVAHRGIIIQSGMPLKIRVYSDYV
jgi:hypothetical protein